MKKNIFFYLVLFLSFLLTLLIIVNSTFASVIERGSDIVLSRDRTVDTDYFATGNTITLSGTVNGDAYLAGGNIIVEGVVNGDLLAAGGVLTIRGRVANDVRVVAGQVIISGEVGNSISAATGSLNVTDSARIGGSLNAASGNMSIFAPVGRGMTFASGMTTLGNSAGADVNAAVGQLTLTSNANINGNLNYVSNIKAQIQPGARVAGATKQTLPQARELPKPTGNIVKTISRAIATLRVITFISYLIIGLLSLYFLPVFTYGVVETILRRPWESLGVGLLTVALLPLIIFILFLIIVGIPLGLIILTAFLISIYLTRIFVAIALGRLLSNLLGSKIQNGWLFFLGLIIYEILAFLPFIGWIIAILAVFFGLGGILIKERDFYIDLREKKLI